jgi:hypothetical protein
MLLFPVSCHASVYACVTHIGPPADVGATQYPDEVQETQATTPTTRQATDGGVATLKPCTGAGEHLPPPSSGAYPDGQAPGGQTATIPTIWYYCAIMFMGVLVPTCPYSVERVGACVPQQHDVPMLNMCTYQQHLTTIVECACCISGALAESMHASQTGPPAEFGATQYPEDEVLETQATPLAPPAATDGGGSPPSHTGVARELFAATTSGAEGDAMPDIQTSGGQTDTSGCCYAAVAKVGSQMH